MPQTVSGPDVAMVGFIPEIPDPALQPAQFRATPWPKAMDMFFKSGNPVPAVASYGDFQSLLLQQEFRVAVALRNVSATWEKGDVASIGHDLPDMVPGYTPIRIWRQMLGGAWRKQHLWYSRGAAMTSIAYSATPTACTIDLTLRVKISWYMNVTQACLTYHLAPWATAKLKYTIYRNQAAQIEFHGSEIPSQCYFVAWALVDVHDVASVPNADVISFISAGNCVDAPFSLKCVRP